jgi:hypothetical protein
MLDAMFNGVFGVTGCLEISIKALRALTVMIRDKDKDEHSFDSMLNAIDSETKGHYSVAARTQARTSQRQILHATSLQTSALQQHREASVIHSAMLKTSEHTKEVSAASNKTLETMQSLLSGSQTLNRKTEEVTRVAAEYGQLVLALTFFSFICACVSTCAVGPGQLRECCSGGINANLLLGSLLAGRMGTQV